MCGDAGSIPASRLYFTTSRLTSDVRSARPLLDRSKGRSRRAADSVSVATPAQAAVLALQLPAAALEVPAQRRRRLVSERHHPHLAALAADDQLRLGRLDVAQAQGHELHAAQPTAVEQFHDEPVAQRQRIGAIRSLHQQVHLVDAQHTRQTPAPPGARQALGGIGRQHARLSEEPGEPAQGRELPRERRRRVPAPPEVRGEGAHLPAAEVRDREVAAGEPLEQLLDVGRVRAARRRGRAPHFEVAEEREVVTGGVGEAGVGLGRFRLFGTRLARSCHQAPPEAT